MLSAVVALLIENTSRRMFRHPNKICIYATRGIRNYSVYTLFNGTSTMAGDAQTRVSASAATQRCTMAKKRKRQSKQSHRLCWEPQTHAERPRATRTEARKSGREGPLFHRITQLAAGTSTLGPKPMRIRRSMYLCDQPCRLARPEIARPLTSSP